MFICPWYTEKMVGDELMFYNKEAAIMCFDSISAIDTVLGLHGNLFRRYKPTYHDIGDNVIQSLFIIRNPTPLLRQLRQNIDTGLCKEEADRRYELLMTAALDDAEYILGNKLEIWWC